MNNYNIEHNVKKTPSKHSNGSNDPPLPLTSSDEEDNINTNATVNTPSPSISSHDNYILPIQYTFESPFNAIHSISYSIHQYSTTNTITNSNINNNPPNNTQNKNNLYDLSLNENNNENVINLIQIDETTEKSSSKASTTSLLNNNKHDKIPNYTNDTFKDGKGYKFVTWKDWENMSKNKFCCNGKIMFGSNFKYFILTNMLIFIPSLLQWIFVFNYIFNKYLYFLSYILFILCIISLYITSFIDPGYLPRGYEITPPIKYQIKSNGSKFCITCKIWRPPRAKHCRYCNCCVRKFDHHCHFIGTCVGQRNEHWFSIFIFLISLYSFYSMIISFDVLIIKFKQCYIIWDTIKFRPYAFLMFIYGLLMFLWVITLLRYRCQLILNQETQNENLKHTFKKNGNPYHKGYINNCKHIYCGKKPKSQIK